MSGAPKVVVVDEFRIDQLQEGAQILIKQRQGAPVAAMITFPHKAEAVIRTLPPSSSRLGSRFWMDVRVRLGSRPYRPGAVEMLVDTVDERNISWGVLGSERELVLQGVEDPHKTVLTGDVIEEILVTA